MKHPANASGLQEPLTVDAIVQRTVSFLNGNRFHPLFTVLAIATRRNLHFGVKVYFPRCKSTLGDQASPKFEIHIWRRDKIPFDPSEPDWKFWKIPLVAIAATSFHYGAIFHTLPLSLAQLDSSWSVGRSVPTTGKVEFTTESNKFRALNKSRPILLC